MSVSNVLETFLAVTPHSAEAQVLRVLVQLGAQFVGASEGSLLVYDEQAKDLVFAMNVGGVEATLIGQRVPLSKGLTGLAAASGEVQIGAPTFKEIRQAEGRATAGDGSPEAIIAAPMLIADALVGVLTAVSFEPGKRFDARDGELYGRIASVAGVVVDQRRRLKVIAAMQEVDLSSGPSTPERRLVATMARLTRSSPDALPRVERLLAEIEGLILASGDA